MTIKKILNLLGKNIDHLSVGLRKPSYVIALRILDCTWLFVCPQRAPLCGPCLLRSVCLFICLLAISYPLAGINFWHICLTNCFVFWPPPTSSPGNRYVIYMYMEKPKENGNTPPKAVSQ